MITITNTNGKSHNLVQREIHVAYNGIADFLSTAPIKTPPTTHWYEGDGVEVDLSQIELQPRSIKIPLLSFKPNALHELAKELHEWQSFTITHHTGIQRRVYLERTELVNYYTLEVSLNEYAPTPPAPATPQATEQEAGEPTIDGTPLSSFGFYILEMDKAQIKAKEGVLINQEYHPRSTPNQDTRTAKIRLFTSGAKTIDNYQAIVHQLTKAGTHTLNSQKVYYRQARVISFLQTGELSLLIELELQYI